MLNTCLINFWSFGPLCRGVNAIARQEDNNNSQMFYYPKKNLKELTQEMLDNELAIETIK